MICPVCHNKDTKVTDSRVSSEGTSIRRRRECLKCNFRFSTFEEVEILGLTVIKNNGKTENYSREKLIKGLKRSLEKRSITEDQFKKLVNIIERDLQATAINKNEIKADTIGKVIMKHLKKVDKVAFIRFASVYRDFKDIETFQEEINKLFKKK